MIFVQFKGECMEIFKDFLQKIENPNHRDKIEELLNWVNTKFPNLEPIFKWNQPMFSNNGTFIIGFSISKQHIAVAPEQAGIKQFSDALDKLGYEYTKEIFRIKWDYPIDYQLLEKIIGFNILDKANCLTFWRK